MNCGICLGFFSNMADFLVKLNEKDVLGAILPEKVRESFALDWHIKLDLRPHTYRTGIIYGVSSQCHTMSKKNTEHAYIIT
jgi:hypothetical protein